MNGLKLGLFVIACALGLSSCSDTETYADQKKKERSAINKYIADEKINVISEKTFFANDSSTDVNKNEYVLFESSGVYMQIIRKGCGKKIKDGESCTVLCRFSERNLMTDTLQLTNNIGQWAYMPDKMSVTNTSGTFTGSFSTKTNESLMYLAYNSASVPGGWLEPLAYINVGRPEKEGDEIAKVKLIVPHTQGQAYATQSVYPCMYEITYEKGI